MGNLKKRSASFVEDDDSQEERTTAKAQVAKKIKGAAGGAQKDSDGNSFWELSTKRRVGLSKFKGNIFINIREYYEADGELKPGKKGISLSIDQYEKLVKLIPELNAELRKEGHSIQDLDTGSAENKPVAKATKKAQKSNIDATSDEESE